MERTSASPEFVQGPFASFIELMVAEGTASVEQHETRLARREGCLEGWQQCEVMKDADLADFELALMSMHQVDKENRLKGVTGEDYWRHRCATVQVEYCYEVLRAAHYFMNQELPDTERKDLSSRAISRYRILKLA